MGGQGGGRVVGARGWVGRAGWVEGGGGPGGGLIGVVGFRGW